MNTDADTTILHLDLMAWLAEKLTGDRLAIYQHTYNQLAFGSWEVIIGTRHKRRRFVWDGKESVLLVAESAFTNMAAPPSWRTIKELRCEGNAQDQVFDAVFEMSRELNAI